MAYALFGGAFNPIHNGHLSLLKHIKDKLDINKLLIIPTSFPPHKSKDDFISSKHRVNMLKLALSNLNFSVELSTYELENNGPSYSINTIDFIIEKYNLDEKPYFVIGDDWADKFDSWYKWDEIIRKVKLVIVRRESSGKLNLKYNAIILDNNQLRISSSDIRYNIKNDKSIKNLVPETVGKYIKENGLYKT